MKNVKNSNLSWWDNYKEKIDELSYPITIITALSIKIILAIASIAIVITSIVMVIKALTN